MTLHGAGRRRASATFTLGALLLAGSAGADDPDRLLAAVENRAPETHELALRIWDLAELGYQEERSSALLQETLRSAGFEVTAGAAAIPTAFVASAGRGRPKIGLFAEYDALPGLSQEVAAERKPRSDGAPGHACGHHLLGTGAVAAAIAVRQWMEEQAIQGTLRLYGTPAEEGGAGKVYLTRAGLFDELDVMLGWHPGDRNQVGFGSSLANKSAKFRFRGVAAHAAAAPHQGRSALDGLEAMTFMVNLLREHVPPETRIHYVVTRGGDAPNIVPEFAELYLYARHPEPEKVLQLWERIVAISEAAAQGTGTQVEHEVIHGVYSLLPNETLARRMQTHLERVGGVIYTPQETAFAEQLWSTLESPERELGSEREVLPPQAEPPRGSTDLGDVSWNVPTGSLRTATWVPGTPAHSWQAVAAGGSSIGTKGMDVAAKVLALTAVDLLSDSELRDAARAEFAERRGTDFEYEPLLGDRAPPLDYRR